MAVVHLSTAAQNAAAKAVGDLVDADGVYADRSIALSVSESMSIFFCASESTNFWYGAAAKMAVTMNLLEGQ